MLYLRTEKIAKLLNLMFWYLNFTNKLDLIELELDIFVLELLLLCLILKV